MAILYSKQPFRSVCIAEYRNKHKKNAKYKKYKKFRSCSRCCFFKLRALLAFENSFFLFSLSLFGNYFGVLDIVIIFYRSNKNSKVCRKVFQCPCQCVKFIYLFAHLVHNHYAQHIMSSFFFIENLHLKASKTYVRVASIDVPLTLIQKKNILTISGMVVRTPNPLNLEIEIIMDSILMKDKLMRFSFISMCESKHTHLLSKRT